MKLTALCIAAAVAATAVLGPVPALAGETTEARANQLPLRFKDANGKVVGRAAWGGSYPYIVMKEGKQTFAIGVTGADPTQLQFRGDNVYYKTSDCSGQAYLSPGDQSLQGLRFATVLSSGDGQLSILVGQGIPALFESQSVRNIDNACYTSGFPVYGVRVTDTIDIAGKYQPPFTIH
jgi:hypothetical protein